MIVALALVIALIKWDIRSVYGVACVTIWLGNVWWKVLGKLCLVVGALVVSVWALTGLIALIEAKIMLLIGVAVPCLLVYGHFEPFCWLARHRRVVGCSE